MTLLADEMKKIASDVSESYINAGACMNKAIANVASKKKLNSEETKRICEFANQQVYLTLFHNNKEGRGNIVFEPADYSKVTPAIQEAAMAETDYDYSPEDFRQDLESGDPATNAAPKISAEEINDQNRVVEAAKSFHRMTALQKLLSQIKTLKEKEVFSLDNSIAKTSALCKAIIRNGESYTDMSKLAMRTVQAKGFGIQKTARLLDALLEEYEKGGFHPNMEMTKTASLPLNVDANIFDPLVEFNLGLEKIAGFAEMEKNIAEDLRIENEKHKILTKAA